MRPDIDTNKCRSFIVGNFPFFCKQKYIFFAQIIVRIRIKVHFCE